MRRGGGGFEGESAKAERVSEYFTFSGADGKDKAMRPVRRFELQAILAQHFRALEARVWYRRLWRWLTSSGSWRRAGLPEPTAREVARGKATPE